MNNNTTKKAEIVKEIKVNDNWADMLGLYLAKDVKRTWTEDFVNEENGEVQTIDRYETVALRGSEIEPDDVEYHVTIKSGKQFNIYDVVSKDFSLAYCGNNE